MSSALAAPDRALTVSPPPSADAGPLAVAVTVYGAAGAVPVTLRTMYAALMLEPCAVVSAWAAVLPATSARPIAHGETTLALTGRAGPNTGTSVDQPDPDGRLTLLAPALPLASLALATDPAMSSTVSPLVTPDGDAGVKVTTAVPLAWKAEAATVAA